jgi:putative nucleotidyltransferase with HDIG domain
MSVHAIREAERTRESYAQRGRPMAATPRRGELVVGGGFLLAALALALLAGVGRVSLLSAALYVLAIAVAGNVRFDVGAGFTVPTQAIFVPMLFALPPSLVPLLVALALALGMTPRIARREVSPSWLLTALGNSWFAIGPAVVLVLAGDRSPVGHWDLLALALAAQFGCDFSASAVRERLCGGVPIRELAAECRPIYAIDVALSMLGLAVAYSTIDAHSQFALLLIAPLFGMLRFFSHERHERLEQLAELNDAYQGTALLLGDVVEADDAYTGEHCKGVVALSLDVADAIGLDADHKRNVEFGALLHDIGKIAVPKEIINKPSALDEEEWAIIKTHTIEGQRMLEKIGGFMNEIGRIVRASHERWDGSGYPDGLSGEAIPLEARIVSACDAFNAMTTTRSYRRAMSFDDAAAELARCAGSHFDPDVVLALLGAVSRAPVRDRDATAPADEPSADSPRQPASETRTRGNRDEEDLPAGPANTPALRASALGGAAAIERASRGARRAPHRVV